MPDQCDNCSFYRERAIGSVMVGECRANPPQIAMGLKGTWPQVAVDDWCGRYDRVKPREERYFGEVPV